MTESLEQKVIRIAHGMDWEDLTDHGSGSCVSSHGCAGVTQSDLLEFSIRLLAEQQKQEQEPVAWRCKLVPDGLWFYRSTDPLLADDCPWDVIEPLYAAPPQDERDAKRLDWIEQLPVNYENVRLVFDWTFNEHRYGQGLRYAIDAAMREREE